MKDKKGSDHGDGKRDQYNINKYNNEKNNNEKYKNEKYNNEKYNSDDDKRNNVMNKVEEQAMRIMEALSGADGELLERSCRPVRNRRSRSGKILSLRGHAGRWAAVLCLAAVGAASWGGYRFMQDSGASGSGGVSGSPQTVLVDEAAPADAAEEAGEAEAAAEAGGAEAGLSGLAGEGKQESEMDGSLPEKAVQETDRENAFQNGASEEKSADTAESAAVDMNSCQKAPGRAYTEKEARALEKTGPYIPAVIPRGYAFESASGNPEAEMANLTVCWTRGMDSIMLFIEETENPPATVDVKKKETYDLRLYEVPYGESVPEQYRENVDGPVFAREDLSLEIVESRMISYDDAGDTDTPRGSFGVLYPDGMLVRFSGRGTASEIWEMFCSIEE